MMTKPTTPDDIDQKNTKAKLQRAIEKYRRTTWSLDFTVEYLESLIASEVHKARVEECLVWVGITGRKDAYDARIEDLAELSKDKEGK